MATILVMLWELHYPYKHYRHLHLGLATGLALCKPSNHAGFSSLQPIYGVPNLFQSKHRSSQLFLHRQLGDDQHQQTIHHPQSVHTLYRKCWGTRFQMLPQLIHRQGYTIPTGLTNFNHIKSPQHSLRRSYGVHYQAKTHYNQSSCIIIQTP